MELFAVIMAGGKGERLWPVSTSLMPKQLIAFNGEKSLLRTTVDRILPLTSPEKICCVTGRDVSAAVASDLNEIPAGNILVEPFGRNTAPCVAFAAAWIEKQAPDAVMAIFPSDHDISDSDMFRRVVSFGVKCLDDEPGILLTIGIMPTRPETGYGYISPQNTLKEDGGLRLLKVGNFHEKPEASTAGEYIKRGFLWNAGMFIWKVGTILSEIEKNAPGLYEKTMELIDSDFREEDILKFYSSCESISIDFAIMEKAENVGVIPASFGWNDVGSWSAVTGLLDKDAHANAVHGDAFTYESSNNVIWSSGKKIVLIGIDDMAVVEGSDAILVSKKTMSQDLSKVLKLMAGKKD
ncbi:MAG TPA: mannose-1-phosphate guanylyltransferase [Desulfomonilia bacterium]